MVDASLAINSFASKVMQIDFVPPSEQLITLTYGQLKDIIQESFMPLRDEIDTLRSMINRRDEMIAALESTQETQADNQLIQLQLINNLRETAKKTTTAIPKGQKTLERIAKIDEVLKARGSTTLKELEKMLKIRPQEMSRLVAKLDKRRYEIFLRAGDKREKVLRLRAQIVNVKR
jgi:hypothetical protein